MNSQWYSRKLHVDSSDAIVRLIVGFVKPLVGKLDSEKAEFRFHFFRYSLPSWFLRLRIRGNDSVLRQVEEYERTNLSKFGARPEAEPYDLNVARNGPFRDDEEVEKAWCVFEIASRIALECVSQGFPSARLRDESYRVGVDLNHLFLNSMGYSVDEEYNVHRGAMNDRAVVLLMLKHGLSEAQVLMRFGNQLSRFNQLIDDATAVLNEGLGGTESANP